MLQRAVRAAKKNPAVTKVGRGKNSILSEQKHPTEDGEAKYSLEDSDYDKPITMQDVIWLRTIRRKSVNDFTAEDLEKAAKWAHKFYVADKLDVKSPFFRAWFGDWRAYEKIEHTVSRIPDYIGSNEARKKNRGYVTNEDTAWTISISREGETNTISHSGADRLSEFGLAGVRELVSNAVLLDSEIHEHHKNNKPNEMVSFDHKMYALGKGTDGAIALYKLTIEEYFQSKSQPREKKFHNLKYIQKVADDIGGRTSGETRSGGSTNDISATYFSISDLFALVKQYDPEFKPRPVHEDMIDLKTGKPKLFYHQTAADFTEFDTRHEGAGTRDNETPFGVFLKTTDADIGLKGGKQMPLYATMSSPLVVNNRAEFTDLLRGYYDYMASGHEMTWEGVRDAAAPAVEWLSSHYAGLSTYIKTPRILRNTGRLSVQSSFDAVDGLRARGEA